MSVTTVLATVGEDLKGFYAKLAADLHTARQAWLIISSAQTRNVLLTIGADAIKLVKDAAAAVESRGLSMTLDAAAIADIKQLVCDAKAGDQVIASDLKALGIEL